MIVTPSNPNSVYVSMIETGCWNFEFDSTYSVLLNGTIRPDEFQQSIENINQAIPSRKYLIIIGMLFLICMSIGTIFFVIGGITVTSSSLGGFLTLIGIGSGIFTLGTILFAYGNAYIQTRCTTQIQQAVARESMKYSMRLPTPCSWRLDVSRAWFGGYGRHRRGRIIYRLVIDIGNMNASNNGNVMFPSHHITQQSNPTPLQSTSFFQQQNYLPPPPPYSSLSTVGFCSQCGVPRQGLTAKFCSSCGQPFQ